MKNLTIICLLFMCALLVSCNSGGGSSSPTDNPESPASDLSGTVSSIINFLNPISSAHAAESRICTSEKTSTREVEIYIVDKGGNETYQCNSSLKSNGSFKQKIKVNLIPIGSVIKIKAFYKGTTREAFVNSSALAAVTVDPASTLAVPVIQNQREKGNTFDAKKIRIQISNYVEKSIVGVKVSSMKADKIASLRFMMENSRDTLEKTLFNNGSDRVMDNSFKSFMANVYSSDTRIGMDGDPSKAGRLVYSEENARILDESINQIVAKAVKGKK